LVLRKGGRNGYPKIGSRVFVGAGAKILGNVTIGDDVVIGANAVVTKDIPSGAVVGGIPAKVLSMEGNQQSVLWCSDIKFMTNYNKNKC
jgi:serine O-acetyltransferase